MPGNTYSAGRVFRSHIPHWDRNVLVVDLACDHARLPTDYEYATGQSFWAEVRHTVLTACAWSRERPHIADLDHDLYFALATNDYAF